MKFVLLLFASIAIAENISEDENALFADSSQMVEHSTVIVADQKSTSFSGSMLVLSQSAIMRSYFKNPDVKYSTVAANAVGNLALDVRMLRGYKAYADFEWTESGSGLRIPEMFLDANIAHQIYFRAGKQVLQWGRGYFFNPTDLINVERKSFFRRIGSREGVFGVKSHIPFGTTANVYGFLDLDRVKRPDSLSGAVKIEFLWDRTEMAFMAWKGGKSDPIFGSDFSTRFFEMDITGEIALYPTFISKKIYFQGLQPMLHIEEKQWAPRVALGLGHAFNVNGIPNRLLTVAEYYFNAPGDTRTQVSYPVGVIAGYTPALALTYLTQSGAYEANSYSQHYAAFFATFSRFIRTELSLSFNVISNLNQQCALISGGITYTDLNDFRVNFLLNGFAGPDHTEYTFTEQAIQAQIIVEATF